MTGFDPTQPTAPPDQAQGQTFSTGVDTSQQQPQTPPAVGDPTAPTNVEPAADPKRVEEPYYCPGCGKRVEYRQQCTGTVNAPHQPIEVVSTDELNSAEEKPDGTLHPDGLTAAPNTDNLG